MIQSNSNLTPCIECGHLLAGTAAKCVNCQTTYPFGTTCNFCHITDKDSQLIDFHGKFHESCLDNVLKPLGKPLNCIDCSSITEEFGTYAAYEESDNLYRVCKHCGSNRGYFYQGKPIDVYLHCANCGLHIITPFHRPAFIRCKYQSEIGFPSIHNFCLQPFRLEKNFTDKDVLLEKRSEKDITNNYLSNKNQIDEAINKIREQAIKTNHKIQCWQEDHTAFVMRLRSRNTGDHPYNRCITFNFSGMYFEIVFWSGYHISRIDPRIIKGTKKIHIDKVAGARLDSWLKWLPDGGHPPVKLLTDEEAKSERRFNKGCLITCVALLLIGILFIVTVVILGILSSYSR